MSVSVYQGDTVELEYTIDNRDMNENWSCLVQVRAGLGKPVQHEQSLDLNLLNTHFVGLMPTSDLAVGSYAVYAQLDNALTGESCEIHDRLIIRHQGVTPSN